MSDFKGRHFGGEIVLWADELCNRAMDGAHATSRWWFG